MVMLGDHGVSESLVEAEIVGKLAADADADLNESLGVGIVLRPGHQALPSRRGLMSPQINLLDIGGSG